jgi:transglutaminase-like putative cysteine protease
MRDSPLRIVAACALPAVAIAIAWLRVESPVRAVDALAIVLLALAPAVLPLVWQRALAAAAAGLAASWLAFGSEPWELLPFRDERVLQPLADAAGRGIVDFYGVVLPFVPERSPEMHSLVLSAIFGFTLAVSLLVAARRPVAAAAVAVAGVGWPATLMAGQTVAIGALALAAALSIPLVLRARSGPSLVAGAAMAAVVVSGAAWASSATTVAREAALDWQTWDIRGSAQPVVAVRPAWDANYEGLTFPPTETVVLTVEGPRQPQYWRTSTLDVFSGDHWFEDLFWLTRVEPNGEPLPLDRFARDRRNQLVQLDRLTPRRARNPDTWIEQEVEVQALVDDRLAASGTPRAIESSDIDALFLLPGGVLRTRSSLAGDRYRIWSYAPNPSPRELAASRPRYPAEVEPYLSIEGRLSLPYGTPGREAVLRSQLADDSYAQLAPYLQLQRIAERVARGARTPYASVLALESWFRSGDFEYDERPPQVDGPPLVSFVTTTKAGYCQHYAGAMALMLRMLGVPARVAVGFTSGSLEEGRWIVTDHDAHAWVEAWFAGHGWTPFDPTPGRGNLSGNYSFASGSDAAVDALRRGELAPQRIGERLLPDSADLPSEGSFGEDRAPSLFGVVLGAAALWALAVGSGKWVLRRFRRLTRDPRRAAGASRLELEAFLRDQGIALPPTGTLDDLRDVVYRELGVDVGPFVDATSRARYGPPRDAPRRAEIARSELRALLKQARGELSVWARARGFVSLRSVRAPR